MISLLVALALAQTPAPAVQIKPIRVLEGLRPLAFAAGPTGSKFVATMEDDSVRIIDAATRQTVKVLSGHPQPCYGVAWSKDGAFIATGDETARIWIWNAVTGKKVKEFRSHIRGIQRLSFNRDHSLMISTGKDDVIKVYDLRQGKELRSILGKGANFYSATFDPYTNEFTTGILGPGARVYNASGKLDAFLTGHDGQGVWDVAYRPDGKMLATAGRDDNVILWDMKKHAKIQTLHGHQEWVESVAFSPNGRYLASGSTDRSVRVWDTVALKPVTILNDESSVGSPVCWTADGKYLITVNVDDYLQINSVTPAQAGKERPVKQPKRHRIRRHHGAQD